MYYILDVEVIEYYGSRNFGVLDQLPTSGIYNWDCDITARNAVFKEKNMWVSKFRSKYKGKMIQILATLELRTDQNQSLFIEGPTGEEKLKNKQKEYEYLKKECSLPINYQPKIVPFRSKIYKVLPDFVPPRKSSYLGIKMRV